MSGTFKLIHSQNFVSSNSILVSHNQNVEFYKIKVIINGQSREDLITSITPDPIDPTNKITVNLDSPQTGIIQVFLTDFIAVSDVPISQKNQPIQKDDSTVINNATTINFEGSVSVIDEGNDKATITVIGDPDQNIWSGISDGSNTAFPESTADTLTLATSSGLNVTVNPTTDTATFSPANDLATIEGLSGTGMASRTGSETWALRTITGTTNQITVTNGTGAAGNPAIAIASNPIIPGTQSVTVPSGTTGQRPGTPTNGMLRYNQSIGLLEAYLDGQWVTLSTGGTSIGTSYQITFSSDGTVGNTWLDFAGNNILSDRVFAIMPFDADVAAFTFANDGVNKDIDIELYRTPGGVSPATTQNLLVTWQIRNARSARMTNFGSVISLTRGDKLGVYARQVTAGQSRPSNVTFILFVRITGNVAENVIDNTSGNMVP